jgi:RNA polymerase primary sigma factor
MAELGARTGLSAGRIEELIRVEHELCRPMMSLEDTHDDDDRVLLDELADSGATPEETTLACRLRAHASEALRALAPREQEVLTLRYGLGREPEQTLEDIGRRFGLTRQRILQIAARALDKLRRSRHAKTLQTFWDA